MGAKKILLVCAALFAVQSYWLYCPVPDGYSPQSTRKLRFFLATIKVTDFLAKSASFLGISSFVNVYRAISSYSVRLGEKGPGSDPEVKETDYTFNGVPVRVYEPAHRDDILPGFVWYHGGGFALGNLDMAADTVRRICKQTNSVVVSVDYRLAPEHVFPAAFEDCVAATKYFITNSAQFKVDPTRVAVGGDSAGGNMAAAVSQKLRDDSLEPGIKLQILVYPRVQSLDFQLPSMRQNVDAPLLKPSMSAFFASMYLGGDDSKVRALLANDHVSPKVKRAGLPFVDVSKLPSKYLVGYVKPSVDTGNETLWNELKGRLLNPYHSPLTAASLEDLPPAYVFSAEHDPLRDDAFLYASRLRESGVRVVHRHSDIGFHGVVTMAKMLPEAAEMLNDLTQFIVDNL